MRKSILVFICLLSCFCFMSCKDKKQKTEEASANARQQSYRSILIYNGTESKIPKEIDLLTKDGVRIVHKDEKDLKGSKDYNILFENFDSSDAYKDVKDFKIIFIDKFGLRYEKEFRANDEGTTEVRLTEENFIKDKGWFKKKAERKLNQ